MPSPSERHRQDSAWSLQAGLICLVVALAAPAATPLAEPFRVAFPLCAGLAGAFFLLSGDLRRYVSWCAWLFLTTPLVRRLADLQVGWSETSLVLLAPYAALLPSLGMIPFVLAHPSRPTSAGLLALTCAATIGLAVTSVLGELQAGVYDFLRWVAPPCLGLLVAINFSHARGIGEDLRVLSILSSVLLGIYAFWQFQTVPAWDAFWMENVDMNSIGQPRPFEVRVFGTMNSPGSFATFLIMPLAFLLSGRGTVRWIALALACGAMALTVVRAAWIGSAIALVVLAAIAPVRTRTSVAAFVGGAFLLAPFVLLVDEAHEVVTKRVQSLVDPSSDVSMNERMHLYASLFEEIDRHPLGTGLGAAVSDQTHASGVRSLIIDGGPVEIVLAVGVIGALVYYAGIALLAASLFRATRGAEASHVLPACRAIVAAYLVMQVLSPTTVGAMGFFFWLALGLGVATIERGRIGDRHASGMDETVAKIQEVPVGDVRAG